MTHFELLLSGIALGFESFLCVVVYLRKVWFRLPLFATYAMLLLIGTLAVQLVYFQYGFLSKTAYYSFWAIVGLVGLARGFAIAELCRNTLRAYRGIWALAWRILVVMAAGFFVHAAWDAWGQPERVEIYGLTLERDIAVGSIAILLAIFLFRKYYSLEIQPLEKWIAVGMILLCVIDALNNTLLSDIFTKYLSFWFFTKYKTFWSGISMQVDQAKDVWNAVRVSAIVTSVSVWGLAMRKPLPEPAPAPELLPREVYAEFSPAVNLRLRAFNDRLLELLKP